MLTADPFNARMEAFLERIQDDRPAKIPPLSEADRKRFIDYVDFRFGYDVDVTTSTVRKRKPVLGFQNDLFVYAEQCVGEYEIRSLRGCIELWKGDRCCAIRVV